MIAETLGTDLTGLLNQMWAEVQPAYLAKANDIARKHFDAQADRRKLILERNPLVKRLTEIAMDAKRNYEKEIEDHPHNAGNILAGIAEEFQGFANMMFGGSSDVTQEEAMEIALKQAGLTLPSSPPLTESRKGKRPGKRG